MHLMVMLVCVDGLGSVTLDFLVMMLVEPVDCAAGSAAVMMCFRFLCLEKMFVVRQTGLFCILHQRGFSKLLSDM